MAPHTIERLRCRGGPAMVAWMSHARMQIDYNYAFTRLGEAFR